ncbi:uncharacterized protein LOC135384658 [Ornithodoros turicata]|uniref:uncharacterized protein LOC135384658 n=1 Tax=Ornithodoros turicata TaxID=34597 RepID=UPI0031395591
MGYLVLFSLVSCALALDAGNCTASIKLEKDKHTYAHECPGDILAIREWHVVPMRSGINLDRNATGWLHTCLHSLDVSDSYEDIRCTWKCQLTEDEIFLSRCPGNVYMIRHFRGTTPSSKGINLSKTAMLFLKHRATLLAVCGIKTLGIIRSLVSPASPSETSYDELIALLKNHFTPKPSVIYSHFQFHKRVQRSNERITSYVLELRRLAEDCNFRSTLSERLRDQLVCGIRDDGLQRRLLAETDLTFENAKAKVLAAEAAADQAKEIQTQGLASAAHHINNDRRVRNPKGSTAKSRHPRDPPKTLCHGCGATPDRDRCPFREAICRHGHKKGHIERVCRAKNSRDQKVQEPARQQQRQGQNFVFLVFANNACSYNSQREQPEEHVSDTASIYQMNNVDEIGTSTLRKQYAKVRIEGSECQMEVDSGSDYSIISEATYKRLWPEKGPTIHPLSISLRDFQKQPIPLSGTCFVDVQYGYFRGPLRLLIADGERVSLLGYEWFAPLGIKLTGVHHMDANPLEQVLKEVLQEGLGNYTGPVVSLPLDPSVPPIGLKARNVPLALRPKIDAALDRLIADNVIEANSNPKWATPVVPVVKPSGEAYLQLRVDDDAAEAQTIITHRGAFKVKRLQYGVNVAPGLFQHLIDELLVGLQGVVPYFDDILIQGANQDELATRLREVLRRLAHVGLRARKDKCLFGVSFMEFLGYHVDSNGIHPADSKVTAIHDAPRPNSKQELQAFLGLLNFYNSFLKDKATVAEPLHRLLDKDSEWNWTTIHDEAFQRAKEHLSSDSVLVPFDEKRPTFLTCDASPYGVGAVLSQQQPDGREAPVAFTHVDKYRA